MEEVNKVLVTENYSRFKNLRGNRETSPQHVAALVRSFEQAPQLRQARPLILNEFDEIIDGQHSLKANIRMGLPVYYMIVPGLTVDDARILNAYQRRWNLSDFAQSYAATHKDYRTFATLCYEYNVSPSAMVSFATGKVTGGGLLTEFRQGKFAPRPWEDVTADLKKLEDFSNYTELYYSYSFCLAFHKILTNPDYNHEHMLKQLEKNGKLHPSTSKHDWLYQLETIYNNGLNEHIQFV